MLFSPPTGKKMPQDQHTQSKFDLDIALFRIARLIFKIHTRVQNYGTDQKLYYAEIHTINVIKQHKGINLTRIAEYLEITKGAVSQNILRLINKGLLEKYEDPEKRSRHILKLTPKGEIAHQHHQNLHAQFRQLIKKTLKNTSESERMFLSNFLADLKKELTGHSFDE